MLFASGGTAKDRRPLPMPLVRVSLTILLAVFWLGTLQLPVTAGDVLTADYQGTLKIGGTGAALGAIAQVAAAFQKKHPGVHFVIPPSLGSTGGIQAVIAGALDLGLSSRPLTEAERRQGAVALEYARTPFLLVTSHQVTGVNFTLKQVASLYAGEIRKFPDGVPMRIILRPEHDADTLLIRSFSPEMDKAVREAHSRKGMIVAITDQDAAEALEKINGAIGWMSLAQLVSEKRSVIPLPLDNIKPIQENLASCRYPYCKLLFVVTRTKPTPIAQSFIEFLTSAEGREILLKTDHVVEVKKP